MPCARPFRLRDESEWHKTWDLLVSGIPERDVSEPSIGGEPWNDVLPMPLSRPPVVLSMIELTFETRLSGKQATTSIDVALDSLPNFIFRTHNTGNLWFIIRRNSQNGISRLAESEEGMVRTKYGWNDFLKKMTVARSAG